MKYRLLVSGILFTFGLSCVATAATPPDKTKETKSDVLKLTVADKDKDIKTVAGKKIEIRLKGNPTTGFQWRLIESKTEVIKPDGKGAYIPDKHDLPRVGSGGFYLFKFVAGKPGKTTINLEYLRPWEKDTPPAEKFSVNVIIAEK